jgi:soluble lytic murein transglycosylase
MNYLSYLINKYDGNYYLAICAYNAGLGNVDNWISSGKISRNLAEYKNVDLPFQETEKYLEKVISSYNMYKFLYK